MSVPRKHHYLPKFFMQRWADDSSNLIEYRRAGGKLITKRKHPAATGYVDDLYANTSKTDPVQRQALELLFMQKVDASAAEALAYLEQHRSKPADPTIRSAWSRFIMSLMHRTPARVEWLRNKVREYETGTLNPDLKRKYSELRGPDDPPTYDEWLKAQGSITPDLLVKLLRLLIDSENIGSALNTMRWEVCTVPGKFGFLTGDIPTMVSNGIGHQDGFIALAIGPSRLFIAANDPQVIQSFTSQSDNALQRALNDACVQQSRHVIVAASDAQSSFVNNRFLRGQLPLNNAGFATWKAPLVRR